MERVEAALKRRQDEMIDDMGRLALETEGA